MTGHLVIHGIDHCSPKDRPLVQRPRGGIGTPQLRKHQLRDRQLFVLPFLQRTTLTEFRHIALHHEPRWYPCIIVCQFLLLHISHSMVVIMFNKSFCWVTVVKTIIFQTTDNKTDLQRHTRSIQNDMVLKRKNQKKIRCTQRMMYNF